VADIHRLICPKALAAVMIQVHVIGKRRHQEWNAAKQVPDYVKGSEFSGWRGCR